MGRSKTVHADLPDNMIARTSGGRRLFYYNTREGKRIPLGDDLAKATMRHAIYHNRLQDKGDIPTWDFRHKLPEEIIANAMPVRAVSGIYFLIDKCEIMYVGQSRDLWQRMQQHRQKKHIEFDAISWILCDAEKLDETEAYYIRELTPIFNRYVPNCERVSNNCERGLVRSIT